MVLSAMKLCRVPVPVYVITVPIHPILALLSSSVYRLLFFLVQGFVLLHLKLYCIRKAHLYSLSLDDTFQHF
jgi:hypothetical protein